MLGGNRGHLESLVTYPAIETVSNPTAAKTDQPFLPLG